MTNRDGWLLVGEVVQRTKYHPEHIRRLIRQGRLEAVRVEGRWFVNPDSLAAYLEEMKQFPQSGPRPRQRGGEEEE